MRDILGITGIRSEYDIMSSVYWAIEEEETLRLRLAVTGAHLSEQFGHTVDRIREDGFAIEEEIYSLLDTDRAVGRVIGLGGQLRGLSQTVHRASPDMLLVLGDREEAMATALVGAYTNVPVVHLCGGDRVVGNVDDQVRHAVTKLAHLHLVTNEESYKRVERLGEQPHRIHNVGNPGLDRLRETEQLSKSALSKRLGFDLPEDEPFILLIQHVISTEIDQAYDQMKTTLEAIDDLQIRTVLSYPNSDAGSRRMIDAIKEYEDRPYLHTSEHIPRVEFVNLMRHASCMLGNSSAGIMESPLLGLPVINVGNRQHGRLHAENVTFVDHDETEICRAVKASIYDEERRKEAQNCSNPYGDGRSSKRIARLLAETDIDDSLLIKDTTY